MKSTRTLSRLIFLIALTLIIEMLGLPQPFTGPLVNMMLILTALVISPWAAFLLGVITPLAAALRGQLPPFLVVMVPFIILANIVLVAVFVGVRRFFARFLRDNNVLVSFPAWLGLIAGALCKFLLLYYAVRIMVPLLIGKSLPAKLLELMSLPQFVTAIIGGGLAFVIFNLLKKRLNLR